MIKPDQVQPRGAVSPEIESQMKSLELACDKAIQRADRSDHWPAAVGRMRMPIDKLALDAVVEKYRTAGWKVTPGGDGNYMKIDRP